MSIDDGCHCVVCGESLMGDNYGNHHCNPKRLEKIENSRKASEQQRAPRKPTTYERLALGVFLLNLNESE